MKSWEFRQRYWYVRLAQSELSRQDGLSGSKHIIFQFRFAQPTLRARFSREARAVGAGVFDAKGDLLAHWPFGLLEDSAAEVDSAMAHADRDTKCGSRANLHTGPVHKGLR